MAPKYSQITKILGRNRVKQNEPLAQYTTFKIGGPADLFYEAKTERELIEVAKLAKELNIPLFILGGGSNILVSDDGFQGIVVRFKNSKYKIQKENLGFKVTTGAGMDLADLLEATIGRGLTGLEFLVGIPGTVGGAVRGNAGAWQENIGDFISSVKIIGEDYSIRSLRKGECQFSYRNSRFKENNEIILGANFLLKKGDKNLIRTRVEKNIGKRKNQPKGPSAGCIFVNPKPDSAGRMIEKCGLKGKKIGAAQFSPQHANFIVNLGDAKASDVLQLIKLAKKEVEKKFRFNLKEEICLVGFGRI